MPESTNTAPTYDADVQAHIDHISDMYPKLDAGGALELAVRRGLVTKHDDGSYSSSGMDSEAAAVRHRRLMEPRPTEGGAQVRKPSPATGDEGMRKGKQYPGMNKNEATLMPAIEKDH